MSATYFVTLPEVAQKAPRKERVELPCPESELSPGTKLIVIKPFVTMGNRVYLHGDTLTLLKRTQESPYGYLSSLGNWVVECPHTISVWSNIEAAVAEGELCSLSIN